MSSDKDPLIELAEVIYRDCRGFARFCWDIVVMCVYALVAVLYPIAYFIAGLIILNLAVVVIGFVLAWSIGSFLGFEQMQPTISNPVVAALGGFANWAAPVLGPVGIVLAVGILAVGWLVWQFIATVLGSLT
jgi:hypothetical protein